MARAPETVRGSQRLAPLAAPRRRFETAVPWTYALALAFWASSWNLRLSILMAWLPVEPVWLASGILALCVVHRLGQPVRLHPAALWPLALLAVAFLPGALRSSTDGYGPVKLATMLFVLLPALCAATLLLDSRDARQRWLWAQLLVGMAVAVATLRYGAITSLLEPGRFTLPTVDTIWAARLVGVAVVVLLLVGLATPSRRGWILPLSISPILILVLIRIGSRGPYLFVMVAVAVVVLVGQCFARRRLVLLLAGVAFAVLSYLYASVGGGSGGRRIVDSLQSGFADPVRAHLFRDALLLGGRHFLGVGWGDFAQNSFVADGLANAHGDAYAHNVFAEAFAEGGIFALIGVLVVGTVAILRLQRLSGDRYDAALLGTLLFWVLNAQVSSDIVGNRFMWISIVCALSTYSEGRLLRQGAVRTGEPGTTEASVRPGDTPGESGQDRAG